MKTTITIALAIMSFLISCTSNKIETNTNTATVETENPHNLNLNQDEKWVVVPEMMLSIMSIENQIEGFKGNTIEEYKSHSKSISELLGELTSNCTMEGEAHDELHKWLIPFIELNDALTSSNSIEKSAEIVSNQKEEIKLFNAYFK